MLALLEGLRHRHLIGLEAEHFDGGAGGLAEEKARMDDLGVIEHQKGILRKEVGDLVEMVFPYGAADECQQLGMVALVDRETGDAVVGERIVIVGYGYVFQLIKHVVGCG